MSLAVTLKDSGEFQQNAQNAILINGAVGTYTFAPGAMIIVAIGACTNGSQAAPGYLTCSDSQSNTYAEIGSADRVGQNFKAAANVWQAVTASGGSVTINLSSGTQHCDGSMYAIYEVTGYDVAAPIGATAIVANDTTSGAVSGALSVAPALTSIVLTFMFSNTNPGAGSQDTGTGWTLDTLFDSTGSQNIGIIIAERRSSSTDPSVIWSNNVRPAGSPACFSVAGIAFEVVQATGVYAGITNASAGKPFTGWSADQASVGWSGGPISVEWSD